MKLAVTTVTNDERYTKHLDLVKLAWNRLGYDFTPIGVGSESSPYPTNLPSKFTVNLPDEMYNSPYKATYVQSLRFWAASNLLKESKCILITDADILPIDKKHFSFELNKGEMIHLNATPYARFDNHPQFPACYYGASYKTFHKCFPRCEDPIKWLDLYLQGKKEFGRDEYWAVKCIRKMDTIRSRFIDARHGRERFSAYDQGIITPNRHIIDFHFPFMENVEEIYKELTKE